MRQPRNHLWAAFLIVAVFAATVHAQAPTTAATSRPAVVVTPPAANLFDIYLLMGQSNMVGRDTTTLAAQVDNPQILALDTDGRWVVARDPIHIKNARIDPGVGPGIPFATEMRKQNPNRTIGLVPCAIGGTALARWVKGADLYENAVARAKVAARAGAIKGVLWHQGESDTSSKANADAYEAKLVQMIADLRSDLNLPNAPIVVGELGQFLSVDQYPYVKTVQDALKHVAMVVPQVGHAESAGLGDKGDRLHFSAAAQVEFGARYAKAMQKLQK